MKTQKTTKLQRIGTRNAGQHGAQRAGQVFGAFDVSAQPKDVVGHAAGNDTGDPLQPQRVVTRGQQAELFDGLIPTVTQASLL